MKKSNLIIPSAELLSEMESLEIMGGLTTEDTHVYAVDSCTNNSGNCVTQCGCIVYSDSSCKPTHSGDKGCLGPLPGGGTTD